VHRLLRTVSPEVFGSKADGSTECVPFGVEEGLWCGEESYLTALFNLIKFIMRILKIINLDAYKYLEYFLDILKEIPVEAIRSIIIVAIINLIAIIWNFISKQHKRNILECLDNIGAFTCDFGKKNNKSYFKKYFDKYTKPTFLTHRFFGNEEKLIITFNKLFKYIINKKDYRRVLMIYAEAGMGKSRLLRFLAYKLL